jgi:hypothetical protein
MERTSDPAELQEAFDRLADLLLFRERFSQDPRGTLERYRLAEVPDAAVEALAGMSPDELELFSRVHRRLSEVPIGDEACLIF